MREALVLLCRLWNLKVQIRSKNVRYLSTLIQRDIKRLDNCKIKQWKFKPSTYLPTHHIIVLWSIFHIGMSYVLDWMIVLTILVYKHQCSGSLEIQKWLSCRVVHGHNNKHCSICILIYNHMNLSHLWAIGLAFATIQYFVAPVTNKQTWIFVTLSVTWPSFRPIFWA